MIDFWGKFSRRTNPTTFKEYKGAYQEAVTRARTSKIDQFISKRKEFGETVYIVEYATRPENTFGSDLLKERVTPTSPR